ncbi:multidrug effflux MFS transporter [Ponticoccus alexandrii]|uniref:Bcr/CflA family efflux transporter n=1 Tax=Ponticoccus alexandrii TaxID=1943633 RepID=A0ABX7F9C9_9RHOB|nr:multidrug effflux MFS transporter [Ponticoccus alexandrii]QRF66872.1 Bcr/CflA family efflux MFS transporter [Ponticoccus alexandrii]
MSSPSPVRFLDRSTPPHISTLVLLAGMSALTMSVFLPSLPDMAAWYEADYSLLQLSVTVYLAANALLQIVVGPISDKIGRRPVILAGLALFCLATLGCLLATNVYVFLLFRMLQAVVTVAMVLSRAVVRDMVPANEAASMIGYVTMGMAVIPMVSPAIGGYLGDVFGWKASFWLMLGLGLFMIWLVRTDLGETAAKSGLTLSQQFSQYPELFRSQRFWGYALACAFSSGAFFSFLGGAPYVGSEVYGLPSTVIGYYFGAPAIGYMLGNYLSGRYSARVGINRMVLIGAVIVSGGMAVTMVLFAIGGGSALIFFGSMTLVGLGNGLTIPNATAGSLSVRPHLAGSASGLGGAIMIGGGAALSALAGAMLQPGSGAWPLLWLMFACGVASVLAIAHVMAREKQLGGLDAA